MTTAASSPAEPAPAPSALHPTASSGDAATPSARPAPAIPSADDIVAALLEHNPDADADMVRKAYEYSSAARTSCIPPRWPRPWPKWGLTSTP